MAETSALPLVLRPRGLLGGLERDEDGPGATPLDQLHEGARPYVARASGDGLEYRFPAGALAGARYLTADMLLEGEHLAVFALRLREGGEGAEGEGGGEFVLHFGLLNQCSARMRLPLAAVDQGRWMLGREGAWLKPMCGGDRVDLAKVDRASLTVARKSERPVRFCMTPITATADEPPLLAPDEIVLPKGPLLDEIGQSTIHDWPGKSGSADEVTSRLRAQLDDAPLARWPGTFSRFGGWDEKRFEATGFFTTEHDGKRWWLVDPEGYAFFSAGLDCVRVDTPAAYAGLARALAWLPDREGEFGEVVERSEGRGAAVNYLAANFIRAFGRERWHESWAEVALSHLRRFGFNTVANWSEWEIARAAGFPYVRPLRPRFEKSGAVFRDFPDVFHPGFAADCRDFAEDLRETADDSAFIGYFLMNEPTWGFAKEVPAAGMLFTTPECETRKRLAAFLRERHATDEALSSAWGMRVALSAVERGEWRAALTPAAGRDLADFSGVMVTKLFGDLSDACREVDPNHLNLGARYYTVPPDWSLGGMKCFDVFSMNCYRERVPAGLAAEVASKLEMPVLIGEWHFGALDAGLPASGIGHVRDQAARGRAYRVYLEDAAAQPAVVGAHYFTLYDQSALGRFDGENYNIGFLDVTNRPYDELARAARASHERMYAVAAGELDAFDDAPEYLPMLFA